MIRTQVIALFALSDSLGPRGRQLEREYATFAWEVLHRDFAAMRFGGLFHDRKSETEACLILAPLYERGKELLRIAGWQAAAVIFDLDPNGVLPTGGPDFDRFALMGKLHGVAEQVADRGP